MKDDVDDLSARARRGLLDAAEFRDLEQRLAASHEASLAHRAGREFDAEDLVLAGDEALVARINQRLLAQPRARHFRREQRRSRLRAVGVVVGGLCVTVAAAAGPGLVEGVEAWWLQGFGVQVPFHTPAPTRPSQPPGAVRQTSPPAERRVAPAPLATPPLATPPARPKSAAPEAPVRSGRRGSVVATNGSAAESSVAESSGAIVDTSASMFAQANLARRQGDLPRAMLLYAELVKRFPGSAEADSAEIALGTLSLQSGAAAQALGYFERYLGVRPGGQLAVEALWGKTRALEALGREAEARRALELLMHHYPRSTYATAARAKLGLPP